MDVTEAADRVVAAVGRERFDEACVWAWRTAAETGRPGWLDWPAFVAEVGHEIQKVLYEWAADPLPDASDVLRHEVVLALYRRMPCHALLIGLPVVQTPQVLSVYWDQVRTLLDEQDDRLARPVAYHLWSGEFAAGGSVADEAWWEATRGSGRSPRRLVRVLEASGPVPWAIKRDLLVRLLDDPMLREHVAVAVAAARADNHGHIDENEARRWGL